jgi:hypothetical protein
MTNKENNLEEDAIRQSRVWSGEMMKGTWDGTGRWHLEDKTWTGNGPWKGGLLLGAWNIKGKWDSEGEGIGNWKGDGELNCNMEFMNHLGNYVIIVIFILTVLISALIYFIGKVGDIATIVIFLLMVVLTILAVWYTRQTGKGKLWLQGTWQDVGDFRILDLSGTWRLGYHTGTLSGKLKDPKPT